MTRLARPCCLVALSLLSSAPAEAQIKACVLPTVMPLPRPVGPTPQQPRRNLPISGHTLAMSWSPQHCVTARRGSVMQCDRSRNRFGFILHGLWPDGEGRDWPQFCRPVTLLTPAALRSNFCATPSVDLMQHQWARHGACMAPTAQSYFRTARRLYDPLRFPEMARLAAMRTLTVDRFVNDFVGLNRQSIPFLTSRSVRVQLTRDGWLDEVRLCLNRQLRPASCRAPQSQRQLMRVRL